MSTTTTIDTPPLSPPSIRRHYHQHRSAATTTTTTIELGIKDLLLGNAFHQCGVIILCTDLKSDFLESDVQLHSRTSG
ncbi:hypothetical protein Sjap_003958 [Stephania japonica]|uniref:Uncharacterized protein n=1 Tax=Stephania japonica TaxID=461633 RepID=A0AAP0PJV2_9MAGN